MTTHTADSLTVIDSPAELPREATSTSALVLDTASMNSMLHMAEVMSQGKAAIPAHLRGSPADCMAVVMQAMQWRMNPFVVAQKTHIVNGALGYEAQLVNAVITSMAPTKDRLHYEWSGNWDGIDGKANKDAKLSVRVWATLKGEDEPRELVVTMAEAGVRNSPLWVQSPKIQLAYLAIKRWARLYTPDVILGVYTPDEFDAPAPRDMGAAEVVKPQVSAALMAEAEAAAGGGKARYQQFWKDTGKDNRHLLGGDHERLKKKALEADAARTVEHVKAEEAVTFAQVEQRMRQAGTLDILDMAADQINLIPDEAQQNELLELRDQLQAKLEGAPA